LSYGHLRVNLENLVGAVGFELTTLCSQIMQLINKNQ